MVLPPSPKSVTGKAPIEPTGTRPTPRLNAKMACDTAFRLAAGRCLSDLKACHATTCSGDADALHRMRIALTRLRTIVAFFSPMASDQEETHFRGELKWLNAHLGAVRDYDVAIDRLKEIESGRFELDYRSWSRERAKCHQRLAMALRSLRYRRLIAGVGHWIQSGPWSTNQAKRAIEHRARPIDEYSARKLAKWHARLIKKSRKLKELGTKKRHRLRLLNKKLSYAIEALGAVVLDKAATRQQALKQLHRAQKSLGQLNDGARGLSLATALEKNHAQAPPTFLAPKHRKRLMRIATEAYSKLAKLQI
jgi:CHAD domain-containing protein